VREGSIERAGFTVDGGNKKNKDTAEKNITYRK